MEEPALKKKHQSLFGNSKYYDSAIALEPQNTLAEHFGSLPKLEKAEYLDEMSY